MNTTHNVTVDLRETPVSTSIPRYTHEIACTCGWSAIRFTCSGRADAISQHTRTRNVTVTA